MAATRVGGKAGDPNRWVIPLYTLDGHPFKARLDTQSDANLLPRKVFDLLAPNYKGKLDTSAPLPTLGAFDGATSTSTTVLGRVTIPVHILSHVVRHGELVPQVWERLPDVSWLVVDGLEHAYIGHNELSNSNSAFCELNEMLTASNMEVMFPRGPTVATKEPPPKLASGTTSGWARVLTPVPHDTEQNSYVTSDPISSLPTASSTTATVEDIMQWDEVKGCTFKEMQRPLAELLHRFQHIYGAIPPAHESRLPPLDIRLKPGTAPNKEGQWRRVPPKLYAGALAQVLKLRDASLLRERQKHQLHPQFHKHALVFAAKYDELTGKPTGEVRVTMDMRYLNSHMSETADSVLPGVTSFHNDFKGCRIFSVADFLQWFHQFRLLERCRHLTGFVLHAPDGTERYFEWVSGPMGWAALPGIAQEILMTLFSELTGLPSSLIRAYVDNIVLGTRVPEADLAAFNTEGSATRLKYLNDHLASIEEFFTLCDKYKLRLKRGKTRFFTDTARSLGLIFDGSTVRLDPARIQDWLNLDVPPPAQRTLEWLWQTVGMLNWHRGMLHPGGDTPQAMLEAIHRFREHFKMLNDVITKAKNEKLHVSKLWTDKHTASFRAMRDIVAQHRTRAIPDFSRPFFLRCDASNTGWAAVLLQADPITGALLMVDCYHGQFTTAASRQKTNHREAFAIVMGIRSMGSLLDVIDFILQTDHNNIRFWWNSQDPAMQRWYAEFSRVNPPIQHIEGVSNPLADALSRTAAAPVTPDRPIPPPDFIVAGIEMQLPGPSLAPLISKRAARAAQREQAKTDTTGSTPTPTPTAATTPPTAASITSALQLNVTTSDSPRPGPTFRASDWLQATYRAQLEHGVSTGALAGGGGGTAVKLQTINDVQVYMKGEQVVIPTAATDLLLQVLARAHDATGHPGAPQTVRNLSSIYIANKQRVVEDYIKSCPACQHAKAPGVPPPEGSMASILPTRPWGCIILDYIGKLPESSTGDSYILSCTDTFTRMSYWLPCKTATADTAIQFFNDICFGNPGHGLPDMVQVDNGKHFEGSFPSALAKLGVSLHVTHPYHAQSNAKDERGHQELHKMIMRVLTPGHISLWPTIIKQLQFFKNARANRHLGGLSPHEVMYGFKARLPLDLLTGSKSEPHLSPDQWLQLLDATHESAAISSALGAMRDKEGYDGKRAEPKRLNVGDTVLVWYPTRASKEVSNWQGPYKVTSPMDEHSFYAVAEMQAHGGLAKSIPVASHRLMYYDMSRTTFEAEAQRDCKPGEFVVSAITAHRDHPGHPGELEFQVSYHGLTVQPWQPVCTLHKLKYFKEYIRAHGITASRIEKQLQAELARGSPRRPK